MRFVLVLCTVVVTSVAVPRHASSEEADTAIRQMGSSESAELVAASGSPETDSWSLLTGENFRIWHRDRELAERVLAGAEKARLATAGAWFPNQPCEQWQPPCDVYLCPSGREYAVEGRGSPNSAGQAVVVKDGHRVLRRKIVVNASDARLLDAVIPHEVAHIVVGSHFPHGYVPRWADEGIAMLSEPPHRQREYLLQFAKWNQKPGARNCRQIMSESEYLHARAAEEFYARSFHLAFYLVNRKGRESLIRYLETAMQSDVATALHSVYEISNFDELDRGVERFFRLLANESGGADRFPGLEFMLD